MTAPLLELDNLEMHFPTRQGPLKAVDGVSLTIQRGETLGLVGESGCGKSTLARALMRLYRPTGGRVVLDGADITTLSEKALKPHRKKVQMIFQDPVAALNGRMTVGELVAEPLEVMASAPLPHGGRGSRNCSTQSVWAHRRQIASLTPSLVASVSVWASPAPSPWNPKLWSVTSRSALLTCRYRRRSSTCSRT